MSGDVLNNMENLAKEWKEEVATEEEVPEESGDIEEEVEAKSTPVPEEESETEEEEAPKVSREDRKKTPEDFKKMRLALKEQSKELEKERQEKETLKLDKARLEGYKEASTKSEPTKAETKETEDVEPDQEYDTLEWLKWNARQQNKLIKDANAKAEKVAATNQAQMEATAISKLDNEFKTKRPDYEDAVNFVLETERKVIKARYPQATDQQITDHLINEKVKLYREEYNAGRVPGEAVMNMAKAYGYTGKKAASNNREKQPNISNIKKNMKKSSPMNSSNQGTTGDIDPEAIFDMSIGKLARAPKGMFDRAIKNAREIDSDGY